MREINECTAEVFRRSEKRIKERKRNRNRILALCIPLCLIVTVCSVTILPAMMSSMRTKNDAAEMVGDTDGSLVCSYTTVEIQNADLSLEYYEKVTDQTTVTNIFSVIHSLFADNDEPDQDVGEAFETNEDNLHTDQDGSTNRLKGYAITFTTEDGSKTVYNLNGNVLLNVNTNETVFLGDEQVVELMAVLAILE